MLLTSLAMLGTLFLAMPVLAQEEFPAYCGVDTLDQFPEGTVCVEGGGFNLPESNADECAVRGLDFDPEGNKCVTPADLEETCAALGKVVAGRGCAPAPEGNELQYTPVVEQYGLEEPAAPQATPAATTQPLPATGGPSLVLLAGALLIGGGLILRGRRS